MVEVAGAFISGSLALLADAAHMFADVSGLALAFAAAALSQRPATPAHTWGFRRAEVLAAAAQAGLLLAGGVFILVESARRIASPPTLTTAAMFSVSLIALVGNVGSFTILTRIQGQNLNTRSARLEVFNDALGALAALCAAILIGTFGWVRADAVASMGIALLILPRALRLLRETLDVLLEASPRNVNLSEVRRHVLDMTYVIDIHDVHATQVASDLPVLTAHVVVEDECFREGHLPKLLDDLQACLFEHFDIAHSTFQLEPAGHSRHEAAPHA